jgi:hypothetical protein
MSALSALAIRNNVLVLGFAQSPRKIRASVA